MKIRLSRVTKECNVGLQTIVEFLGKKGITVDATPNAAINEEQYEMLKKNTAQIKPSATKQTKSARSDSWEGKYNQRKAERSPRDQDTSSGRYAPQSCHERTYRPQRQAATGPAVHTCQNGKTDNAAEKTETATENPASHPEKLNVAAEKMQLPRLHRKANANQPSAQWTTACSSSIRAPR